MCRLSAFFGAPICAADLVTRPSRSIITQSFDARERMTGDASTPGYLNGDGFGLGWYSTNADDPIPCVYRQARPAWNDPNLSSLAEKVHTGVLFAHVRAASAGLDVSEGTCHPFRFGRYLFMHNGGIGGFVRMRRRLLAVLREAPFDFAVANGSSDTALCFAIFLSFIDDPMVPLSPDKLRTCLEATISTIERAQREEKVKEVSLLNFVVSDGESLLATRYVININDPHANAASLYYASGNSYQSDKSSPGNYVMMHTDRRPSLTIISSEPLTESRADWVSVPRNFCIVITQSMHILLSVIRPDAAASPDDAFSRIVTNLTVTNAVDNAVASQQLERHPRQRDTLALQSSDTKASSMENSKGVHCSPVSAVPLVVCPVGAAVRSTITIPDCTVLCCTTLGSLLCSGTNNGKVHVWDVEESRKHSILETGDHAVLALLSDVSSRVLVCGTSASTVVLYQLSDKGEFLRTLVVCCEGMGDILSLAKVNRCIFAGFSDAGLRCVVKNFLIDESRYGSDSKATASDFANFHSLAAPIVSVSDSGHEFPKGHQSLVHNGFVFSLATFHNGSLLCSGCGDGILRVWDVNRETCVQSRNDHAGAILALAVYEVQRGTMLFSGSRDCSVKVWLWDGDKGFTCKRTLRKHKDEVVFLSVAGDKLVSGSADGAVCVWCAITLRLICQYRDSNLKAGGVSHEYNSLFTATEEDGIQVRDIILTERNLLRRDSGRTVTVDDMSSDTLSDLGLASNGQMANGDDKDVKATPSEGTDSLHGDKVVAVAATVELDQADKDIVTVNPGSAIVSELDDDSDDAETLVPGVTNECVLAPPMSPLPNGTTADSTTCLLRHAEDDVRSGIVVQRHRPNKTYDDDAKELVASKDVSAVFPHVFERRLIEDALRRFISFPTVANSEQHRESCWQGARYIGRFLELMGASVKFVNSSSRDGTNEMREDIPSKLSNREARALALQSETNPIVLARFVAAEPAAPTITFYGHYDVMPAMDLSEWETDPWSLKAVDGYFYGRGATDNKGPIIAMVFAVKKLMEESVNGLGVNIVLVLQGEGESSNAGFHECVTSHQHWFERTCLILTSNSIWLGENRPCLTYGFRGVIDLLVSVTGGERNLHSGIDGGAVFEPMNDLITVLGTLVDASGVVCVPGFYDDVRPLSRAERERLSRVEFDVDEYRRDSGVNRFTTEAGVDLLECRWRKPSVSITAIETSNMSSFFSVVPRRACAKISIRFVPDQNPAKIERAVCAHLQHELRKRRSPNRLDVRCVNRGDWWLGDPTGEEFQIAARAVRDVWGVDAQYVCEGGSMSLFSFLVDTLKAPLIQVPLGQSSDSAHLPNERIRAVNLFRGKEVLQRIIAEYARRAPEGKV